MGITPKSPFSKGGYYKQSLFTDKYLVIRVVRGNGPVTPNFLDIIAESENCNLRALKMIE